MEHKNSGNTLSTTHNEPSFSNAGLMAIVAGAFAVGVVANRLINGSSSSERTVKNRKKFQRSMSDLSEKVDEIEDSELSEVEEEDMLAFEGESVLGGESLYCTSNDEIALGREIRNRAKPLVQKLYQLEASKAYARYNTENEKFSRVKKAHDFIANIRRAEDTMVVKKVKKQELEDEENLVVDEEKSPLKEETVKIIGEKLIEDGDSITSEQYSTLNEKLEAEKRIREREGKGVRLPGHSGLSDDESLMTIKKPKLEPIVEERSIDAFTACSEYEKKMREQKKDKQIKYPNETDMNDRNDYMFFKVFSAMTEGYIKEEVDECST